MKLPTAATGHGIVTSAALFAVDVTAEQVNAVEASWATMTREIKASKIGVSSISTS